MERKGKTIIQIWSVYIQEELGQFYSESEIASFIRIIVPHITGYSYLSVFTDDRIKATREQQSQLENILERLKTYEPLQYILGETEFFGLPFIVDNNTLIPRPETEELVELIVNENRRSNLSVLDIGTGSGCIAIALVKHMDRALCSAWDFSQGALNIALTNAESNGVKVNFEEVDVLKGYPNNKKYDIIVSNPPYVLDSEKTEMDRNVLDFEPHSALFVPDSDPLLFYKRIADIATEILKPHGKLYFEINRAKGLEIMDMLCRKSFTEITIIKDISGNDRFVQAVCP